VTLTTAKITRATGLAAVMAGLLFIVIQPIHPAEELATVTSTAWAVVGYMTLGFAILGLVGVTGIYLRQVKEAGVLGLVGYVLLGLFFLLATAFTFAEIFILPPLASHAPQFVDSFLGIFAGSPGDVDLGALGAMSLVSFGLYMPGGVLFGIALFRARVLPRWAALTLVFAALSTLLVPALPHSVGRYAAVPFGVALIWLGWSLWSERGETTTTAPSQETRTARFDFAEAE
jgi:hypothetical protein